jgi:predicted ATPase/DNA-binding SARP family transcriptional activator
MPSDRRPSPAAVAAAAANRPPLALTRMVGRRRELDEVASLLDSARLVTLTGVGGGGKSRLAAELARRYSDGRGIPAIWAELSSCSDPLLVPSQVATLFSLRESSNGPVPALVEVLRDGALLLILDNCEQVIDACAELAATLLSQCPHLTILTTSREPLGIAGERVWPVPPLALPAADTDPNAIRSSEAVELFVDRALSADPSFELTATNGQAVSEICRRLDGIPLAIELAAARVRLLSPAQILARLNDRFALLGGASRGGAARHRTLRAAVDWSYALLDPAEQRLLSRLAVFAGSFALEEAEAVCSDDSVPPESVLELLGGLVDKSLVVASARTGAARYSMLETISSYAADRLEESGFSVELRRRHARAFLSIARSAVPDLMIASTERLERLDEDRDNFRAALAWSLENEPETIGLPLVAALRWYWYYGIRWREGIGWLTRALDRTAPRLTPERAEATTARATLASYLGETESARTLLVESERMWRELGDERQLSYALSALAQLLASSNEVELAGRHAAEAVRLARRGGIAWDIGYCLTNAAAFVAQIRGDFELADEHLAEAETIWADSRHPLGFPFVLNARALLALRRDDKPAAARLARRALAETRERHELWFTSRSLRILAFTSGEDPLRAARLLGAAAGMLQTVTAGMLLHEKSEHDRLLVSLHERLSADVLEAAMREGRQMSFEEACSLALESGAAESSGVSTLGGDILRISDLGPLRITLGDRPIDGDARSSARARELLAFLASHPSGRTKEEAGVALWPDASTDQLKNSFHVTLHRLRKLLGQSEVIVAEGNRYRLNPDFPHEISSRRFEAAVGEAMRASTIESLSAALAIYEGDFLQGDDAGEWSHPIRTHLRQLFVRGLFTLAQRLEGRGRFDEASEAYLRVISREPFQEAAWRGVMLCRARLGARSESLRLYRDLEERLREELSTKPESETSALVKRIEAGEVAGGQVTGDR